MAGESAAKRYAKALFGLAEEQGKLDTIADDLQALGTLIHESPELGEFLEDSVLPAAQHVQTIQSLLGDKVDELTLQFLLFLVEKGRLSITSTICRVFTGMVDAHKGIVHARIITARELDATQLTSITERLNRKTGKSVQVTVTIEPALLAGFMVRLGDTVIDLSLKTQLESLHDRIINA